MTEISDTQLVELLQAAKEQGRIEAESKAIELLTRLRQWDHLETAGDGPYWVEEIDNVLLGKLPTTTQKLPRNVTGYKLPGIPDVTPLESDEEELDKDED